MRTSIFFRSFFLTLCFGCLGAPTPGRESSLKLQTAVANLSRSLTTIDELINGLNSVKTDIDNISSGVRLKKVSSGKYVSEEKELRERNIRLVEPDIGSCSDISMNLDLPVLGEVPLTAEDAILPNGKKYCRWIAKFPEKGKFFCISKPEKLLVTDDDEKIFSIGDGTVIWDMNKLTFMGEISLFGQKGKFGIKEISMASQKGAGAKENRGDYIDIARCVLGVEFKDAKLELIKGVSIAFQSADLIFEASTDKGVKAEIKLKSNIFGREVTLSGVLDVNKLKNAKNADEVLNTFVLEGDAKQQKISDFVDPLCKASNVPNLFAQQDSPLKNLATEGTLRLSWIDGLYLEGKLINAAGGGAALVDFYGVTLEDAKIILSTKEGRAYIQGKTNILGLPLLADAFISWTDSAAIGCDVRLDHQAPATKEWRPFSDIAKKAGLGNEIQNKLKEIVITDICAEASVGYQFGKGKKKSDDKKSETEQTKNKTDAEGKDKKDEKEKTTEKKSVVRPDQETVCAALARYKNEAQKDKKKSKDEKSGGFIFRAFIGGKSSVCGVDGRAIVKIDRGADAKSDFKICMFLESEELSFKELFKKLGIPIDIPQIKENEDKDWMAAKNKGKETSDSLGNVGLLNTLYGKPVDATPTQDQELSEYLLSALDLIKLHETRIVVSTTDEKIGDVQFKKGINLHTGITIDGKSDNKVLKVLRPILKKMVDEEFKDQEKPVPATKKESKKKQKDFSWDDLQALKKQLDSGEGITLTLFGVIDPTNPRGSRFATTFSMGKFELQAGGLFSLKKGRVGLVVTGQPAIGFTGGFGVVPGSLILAKQDSDLTFDLDFLFTPVSFKVAGSMGGELTLMDEVIEGKRFTIQCGNVGFDVAQTYTAVAEAAASLGIAALIPAELGFTGCVVCGYNDNVCKSGKCHCSAADDAIVILNNKELMSGAIAFNAGKDISSLAFLFDLKNPYALMTIVDAMAKVTKNIAAAAANSEKMKHINRQPVVISPNTKEFLRMVGVISSGASKGFTQMLTTFDNFKKFVGITPRHVRLKLVPFGANIGGITVPPGIECALYVDVNLPDALKVPASVKGGVVHHCRSGNMCGNSDMCIDMGIDGTGAWIRGECPAFALRIPGPKPEDPLFTCSFTGASEIIDSDQAKRGGASTKKYTSEGNPCINAQVKIADLLSSTFTVNGWLDARVGKVMHAGSLTDMQLDIDGFKFHTESSLEILQRQISFMLEFTGLKFDLSSLVGALKEPEKTSITIDFNNKDELSMLLPEIVEQAANKSHQDINEFIDQITKKTNKQDIDKAIAAEKEKCAPCTALSWWQQPWRPDLCVPCVKARVDRDLLIKKQEIEKTAVGGFARDLLDNSGLSLAAQKILTAINTGARSVSMTWAQAMKEVAKALEITQIHGETTLKDILHEGKINGVSMKMVVGGQKICRQLPEYKLFDPAGAFDTTTGVSGFAGYVYNFAVDYFKANMLQEKIEPGDCTRVFGDISAKEALYASKGTYEADKEKLRDQLDLPWCDTKAPLASYRDANGEWVCQPPGAPTITKTSNRIEGEMYRRAKEEAKNDPNRAAIEEARRQAEMGQKGAEEERRRREMDELAAKMKAAQDQKDREAGVVTSTPGGYFNKPSATPSEVVAVGDRNRR